MTAHTPAASAPTVVRGRPTQEAVEAEAVTHRHQPFDGSYGADTSRIARSFNVASRP
jgi:hypothetical protein